MRNSFGEINTMMHNLSGLGFDRSAIDNLSEECLQSQADAEPSHSKITLNSSSNTSDSYDRPRSKNSSPVNNIFFVYQVSIIYFSKYINILITFISINDIDRN